MNFFESTSQSNLFNRSQQLLGDIVNERESADEAGPTLDVYQVTDSRANSTRLDSENPPDPLRRALSRWVGGERCQWTLPLSISICVIRHIHY